MRAGFMNKESQRKWKMENGNSKNETRNMNLANRREKTDLTERRGVRGKKNLHTKKSRTKRRRPIKRSTGPPLIEQRGRRLSEWKKEAGMALKRDSSRML